MAEVIDSLCKKGASVSATTKAGKTAISIAVSMGSVKAAEALLIFDKSLANVVDVGGSVITFHIRHR